jgi:polysaccharide biosynthesis/export protein
MAVYSKTLASNWAPARVPGRRLFPAMLAPILWLTVSVAPAFAQTTPGYALQPGDQLEISVWGEEELQRTVMVRPDGRLSFPLADEIDAAGRTASDVRDEITQRLLTYIPEAVVTVSVASIDGNQIYVIGQVNRPGNFVMNPQLSVLQALSLAGGMTAFASVNNIVVVRGRGSEQQTFPFRYSDVSRGQNLDQNIQLQSGDVIIVP